MSFAIDLSARQSSRTLEQAVRHQNEVLLYPRLRVDEPPIAGHFEPPQDTHNAPAPRRFLIAVIRPPVDMPETEIDTWRKTFASLPGTYVDASFSLGEHRYMFSADIVDIEQVKTPQPLVRILMTKPTVIQVAQRRRYRRIRLAHSSQVALKWKDENINAGGGVGWLCNISQNGIACRTEPHTADLLCIGEQLQVEFGLSTDADKRYTINAVLCSKTPAGTQGKIILGLQFQAENQDPETSAAIAELSEHLAHWYARVPSQREEADT